MDSDPKKKIAQQDLTVIKSLRKANYAVYVAQNIHTKDVYALKVFPFVEGEQSVDYVNEAKFTDLDHPNVVKIIQTTDEGDSIQHGQRIKISYLLLEYAPYGDFYDVLITYKVPFNAKLARTYFRELIEGLDHLHNKGIAHLDLKPENLLLGEQYRLLICDFDLSHREGDKSIKSRGSRFFRAPELLTDDCKNPKAADIFSAGILLFVFKSGGRIPEMEEVLCENINLLDLMEHDNAKFWEMHEKLEGRKPDFFDPNFKELFNGMTDEVPEKRWTIKQIKEAKWYNDAVYNQQELTNIMSKYVVKGELS